MAFSKAEVRASALAKREAVSAADRGAFAARLASVGPRLVLEFAPPNASLVVALFASIRSEPDLGPLAVALREAGVVTALPVTSREAAPLTFRRWSAGDPTDTGPFRVPHPLPSAETLEPDVVFVPLAAFDRRGHRIGYGGGHYDRTLGALRARKAVRAVGVAFAVQEVLFIPSEAHDEALDLVVTDRETLLCGE